MLACSTWGGGGAFGAEGSLAAVGSIKSGCSSCCADAAERGVLGSRWGVSLFCARFALSKLRLLLFEARLSGYCVREGEVKGINPGFLVLGFSTRALKSRGGFRQDECRPGASAWACCLWFVALLHVRGSWSSWVFRAVHRCCFLGSCSPFSKDHLVVKLHCVSLQHFGGGWGFRSRGLLAASGFTQIWLHLVLLF